ncbi:MAG TPA: TadE/TadG family type IV pilus assembly protein [Stellaceae bacterium]|nr:TadE/TadG family type IV pilus assembly protein [Stellaceae bacterium]
MLARIANFAIGVGQRLTPWFVRRLVRSGDGATAIEFALIAPPFLAMLVAILETGMVFFFQQVLQTSTTQAARLIMTGQAQTQKLTSAQFVQDVCSDAGALFNCANLYANVQTFTSFSGMSMGSPVQNGTFSSSNLSFSPGGPGDIVLVQVFYQLPVSTAPLGFSLASTNTGNALLMATSVFRNEPYQ